MGGRDLGSRVSGVPSLVGWILAIYVASQRLVLRLTRCMYLYNRAPPPPNSATIYTLPLRFRYFRYKANCCQNSMTNRGTSFSPFPCSPFKAQDDLWLKFLCFPCALLHMHAYDGIELERFEHTAIIPLPPLVTSSCHVPLVFPCVCGVPDAHGGSQCYTM